MDFADTISTDDFLIMANDIRKEYNKLRETFYRKTRSYYNQAIAGTYHKEDDLITMLNEMKRLKDQYVRVCNILRDRGVPVVYKCDWTKNNDHLFKQGQLLHAV